MINSCRLGFRGLKVLSGGYFEKILRSPLKGNFFVSREFTESCKEGKDDRGEARESSLSLDRCPEL